MNTGPAVLVETGDISSLHRRLASVVAQTVMPATVFVSDDCGLDEMLGSFDGLLPIQRVGDLDDRADTVRLHADECWLPHHLESAPIRSLGRHRWAAGDGLTLDHDETRGATAFRLDGSWAPPPRDSLTISVIVPAYNADRFVRTSLGSLMTQTRPPDEVVVVDDGSTDDTARVIERFETALPLRVIVLPENRGIGPARHSAIEVATGDQLLLLDADDFLLPDHIETLVRCRIDERSLVTARPLRWVSGEQPPLPLVDFAMPMSRFAWRQRTRILGNNFLFVATMFDRGLYDAVGGFAPLQGVEDWDLWRRMLRGGAHAIRPRNATVLYRRHARAVSGGERGLLDAEIDLLENLVESADGVEGFLLRRALTFRHARDHLARGRQHAIAGDDLAARRENALAAVKGLAGTSDPRRRCRTIAGAGIRTILPRWRVG